MRRCGGGEDVREEGEKEKEKRAKRKKGENEVKN